MRLRYLPLAFLLSCFPFVASAQSRFDQYKNVADHIVSCYNKKAYVEIREHFGRKMKIFLSKNKVNEVFTSLYDQGGKITGTGTPWMDDSTQLTLPLIFEKDSLQLDMLMSFNAKNKITGLRLLPSDRVKYPKISGTTTIDDIARPYIDRKENAGLTIGVYSKNQERYYAYGEIAKGTKVSPDSATIYEIGSITKVFTAFLLADLVRHGRVKYNDPASKFLPDSIPALQLKGKQLKLQDLATHTSGLPRLPGNLEATIKDSLDPYANYTRNDLYSFLKDCKLGSVPGETYVYSNLGAGLLGDILSQQLNLPYEDALRQELLNKAGMTNTSISLPGGQKVRLATGYSTTGIVAPYWNFQALQGAGALHADARDLVKFLKLNLGHGEAELAGVLEETHKRRTTETALGWHFMKINNETILWHNGGTFGFSSFIGFDQKNDTGVVVLSNSGNSVDDIGKLVLELLQKSSR